MLWPIAKTISPFGELSRLQREMNHIFGGELAKGAGIVTPSFEVSETKNAIKVSAELPGMDEKDIDVSVDNNMLTIKGEKKQEREEKDENYHFTERSYGSFQRSFGLREGLDLDKVKANFKKGVLNITIPKTKEAKSEPKKIDVNKE